MKIKSVEFLKGIVGEDSILMDGTPQIAFVGRSNVGKSSLINLFTNSKISRTSANAGSTQEANIFLVNNSFYLVDLPGYGFARASGRGREKIGDLIEMYLFNTPVKQKKVVFIIDANIGMTDKDLGMFTELKEYKKDFVIVANKIDKMSQSEYHKKMAELKRVATGHVVIPFSTKKQIGLDALMSEIFK